MNAQEFLASVKARAKAATPGPWHQWEREWIVGPIPSSEDAGRNEGVAYTVGDRDRENAAFIAAARTDIDRLVAMVEAARKLSRGIAAEYADSTQGPSETLGKIAMRAEEYDAELDRIAAGEVGE